MATQTLFHLGNHPELSAAEIEALIGHRGERHHDVLLTHLPDSTTPSAFIEQLGGCIKMSEIIAVNHDPQEVVVEDLLANHPQGKLEFGLNRFPAHGPDLKTILVQIKKALKQEGRSSRFLNTDGGNLPSATIVMAGLLHHGTDYNLIKFPEKTFLTRTIAVQPFDRYKSRDYEKPVRLRFDGMLPPKLAQVMINLAGPLPTGATLYDPFCGSGTILGEALLKGMNVIGSDADPNAIAASKKNLMALRNNPSFSIKPEQTQQVFEQDARQLTQSLLPSPPTLVVTELDLGPPLNHAASSAKIEGIQNNLLPLYKDFLHALSPLLLLGTPAIIAFPLHYSSSGPHPLKGLDALIHHAGFTSHRLLVYHRPEQAVGREIRVLERR